MQPAVLKVNVECVGDLAIIECDGRIVRSDAALRLREVVTSQSDARTIVLELSRVGAIEGGGLGMLLYLQRWARSHDIRLKLFNPCKPVLDRLTRGMMSEFDFVSIDEMMALLGCASPQYLRAS
jgi:anti-anti-sigma regulatory factor